MALENIPILSLLLAVPAVGLVVILALGNREKAIKIAGIATTTIPLLLTVLLWLNFDSTKGFGVYQFLVSYEWAPAVGITYTLGVDGISLPMIALTAALFLIGAIYSWGMHYRIRAYFTMLLLQETAILGVFMALDFILFFVFWELVIIPMYFLIGIWGGGRRDYSAIKFFLYTHVGSLMMLLVFFALYFSSGRGTFSMIAIQDFVKVGGYSLDFQRIAFIVLLVSFGIKMPLVPFHTWLPDAHVDAPTVGSVILAGLLLKMGAYGLIRIAYPMLPQGASDLYFGIAPALALAFLSIIYASAVCLVQVDLKRLIAYSSIGHMGFVLLGFATLSPLGISGGVFQMFNHGLITAVLFMIAGSIQHNVLESRNIPELRGLMSKLPQTTAVMALGFFAGFGLPGMNGFVSELMVILSTYKEYSLLVFIPLLSIIITVAYFIWALHRIAFGSFNEKLGEVKDLHIYEQIPLWSLVVFLVVFGLYPNPVLQVLNAPSLALTSLFGG